MAATHSPCPGSGERQRWRGGKGHRIVTRGAIRKGLVHELLYAQDTVLCSYFAQREDATNGDEGRRNMAAEVFQGLDRFG